jgi:hypothetical protein
MTSYYDETVFEEMDALKREAAKKTGFDDFGDTFFEGPLAAWVKDLSNRQLNDFGYHFLRRLVLRDLRRRLKVLKCLFEHPEILEVKIPPIILIMGAPRTGTTLMHHLMATHPLARSLLRWELMDPVPPPTSETYTTDPRIAKMQSSIEPLRGSLLERMHWVNAVEPDENAWGYIDCTGLLGQSIWPIMPTWFQWLGENNLSSTLRDFRKVIQILIWKCPPPRGGHLVLKCIAASVSLHSISDVFPEAVFIFTHRDPFRVLISICTMYDAICQPFIKDTPGPLHEDGINRQDSFKQLKAIFRELVGFAKAEPTKIMSVRYADLMNDAVLATRSIYDYCRMEPPKDLEQLIKGYLKQQRKGKRVAPPESYGTFGYDSDVVWTDPIVAEYCKFFEVQQERSRLIDTKTGS